MTLFLFLLNACGSGHGGYAINFTENSCESSLLVKFNDGVCEVYADVTPIASTVDYLFEAYDGYIAIETLGEGTVWVK